MWHVCERKTRIEGSRRRGTQFKTADLPGEKRRGAADAGAGDGDPKREAARLSPCLLDHWTSALLLAETSRGSPVTNH